jgi:short-subunit dehydrogenase
MDKTIIITGSSTGIGKSTAKYFAQNGWNVLATMRSPDKERELHEFPNISIHTMDVTSPDNIRQTIEHGIEHFGKIDVLVNNAGIGVFGAFEAASSNEISKQFDVNLFGMMNMVSAILPHYRKNGQGTIINISSGVGRIPMPMQTLYSSTKFAIEGFSESISYELASLGISVKIVLPGNVRTNFFKSLTITDTSHFPEYSAYQKKVIRNIQKLNEQSETIPDDVAAVIYKAATDGKNKLRYTAGKDIALFSKVRKVLPDRLFMKIVKRQLEK